MRLRRERAELIDLPAWQRAYLETGTYDLKASSVEHGYWSWVYEGGALQTWRAYSSHLLGDWIDQRPGTRPAQWWTSDAPRWGGPYPGRTGQMNPELLRELPEPRRRVGGTGKPSFDVLNVWPGFAFGLPNCWISTFDEEYYNGRRLNVHGERIGTEYREGHFLGLAPRLDDPPTFESEAAYLERHGLLRDEERVRLSDADFRPVPIEVEEA